MRDAPWRQPEESFKKAYGSERQNDKRYAVEHGFLHPPSPLWELDIFGSQFFGRYFCQSN